MRNNILFAWTVSAVLILGAFTTPIRAAVTEAWVQRYSNTVSNRTAEAVKAVFDPAGNVIVIGNIPESGFIAIIKYSGAGGSILWQQRYRSAGA